MTASLDWLIEGNMMWQDSRYVNQGNTLKLDDYSLWNFRLGVANERWDAVAFIDNAFDDDTVKNGFDSIDTTYLAADFSQGFTLLVPSGARYMLPDPRTYGVRVSYRFGK
jgi:outer membrane cobalamin receptor